MIPVEEIEWIEAANYYSRVHCPQPSHLIRRTLKDLAQQLDPQQFIRVHRSALVNASRIRKIVRYADPGIVLHSGVELPLSRRLRAKVEAFLRSMGQDPMP